MAENPTIPVPEICQIRIIFPVVSDEQALGCKKKIAAALADIKDVAINFTIGNLPPMSPLAR
ncbi:MAG: hypothetical protein MUP81_03695 [Dehalococcoidia bacterium]|nr:hypothetical protein [Dehalococcoidia bacterium]